jgi:hypothetical protein
MNRIALLSDALGSGMDTGEPKDVSPARIMHDRVAVWVNEGGAGEDVADSEQSYFGAHLDHAQNSTPDNLSLQSVGKLWTTPLDAAPERKSRSPRYFA